MEKTNGDVLNGFLSDTNDVKDIIEKRQNKLKDGLSVESLVAAQREDMELYENTKNYIDEQKGAALSDDAKRESYETAYSLKMQLLYSMARRFHPRSGYGRRMLMEASDTRREFESTIGAYTVWLTKENLASFDSVLSVDIAESITCGKSFGIGAVRSTGNKAYGVGAVAGEIGADEISVNWLFVDEEFRSRGVAHSLIGELIGTADKNRISTISFDMSLDNEWLLVLGFMLNDWRFSISTDILNEAVINISDIKKPPKLASKIKDAKDIGGVDIDKYLRSRGYRGFLLNAPAGYIDKELSCCYGKMEDPSGILLAHRQPSGRVRVEYLYGEDDNVTVALTCYFVLAAMEKCDTGTELFFPVSGKDAGRALDAVLDRQRGVYIVRGTLKAPDNDVDWDDVNELLSLSEEEIKEADDMAWS